MSHGWTEEAPHRALDKVGYIGQRIIGFIADAADYCDVALVAS